MSVLSMGEKRPERSSGAFSVVSGIGDHQLGRQGFRGCLLEQAPFRTNRLKENQFMLDVPFGINDIT